MAAKSAPRATGVKVQDPPPDRQRTDRHVVSADPRFAVCGQKLQRGHLTTNTAALATCRKCLEAS